MKTKTLLFLPLILAVFAALFATKLEAQIPQPLLYLSFEEADPWQDQSATANVVNVSGNVLGVPTGAPNGPSPGNGASFTGGHLKVPGIHSLNDLQQYTMVAWLKPNRDNDGAERYVFGQESQGIHNGIRNNMYLHHAHWGSDQNGSTPLQGYFNNTATDGWIHATWTWEAASSTGQIYLDGVLDGQWNKNPPNQGNAMIIGGRNGGTEQYRGIMDEVAIWNSILSAGDIAALADGAAPVAASDEDEDTLPDWWERKYANDLTTLNGLAGDFDEDGLTDYDEFENRTDPTEEDTDGDGLADGAEVAAGTNPASGDTDGDGLNDGVETNTGVFAGASDTGTDPNSKDTDSDGFSDGTELDLGSNPVNPNDFPASLLVYYDFEGDVGTTVTDKGEFGNDGTFKEGAWANRGAVDLIAEGAPAGSSPGCSAQFSGGFINVAGIDMNTMIRDFDTGDYTMTCWIKPTDITGEKFIFGQTNQGIHNGIRNNSHLHQAHWGADTNGSTQLAPYIAADADGWIHVAFVYSGETDQGTIYLDGQQDWTGQKDAPNGGGNLIIGGRNNGDGQQYQGLIDEVAIWRSALSAEKILELAEGGSPLGGSRVPLSITDISANFSGVSPVVTISFNSKSGRIYAVDRTTDFLIWEELDDGVEGEVESTDFTDSFLPEDSKTMFYRVHEVE
ncbi:MAG: LamG-like jellyroll fold domain-containing protein [Verrucomicrobiales bacterium]